MNSALVKVLGICGSLRESSFNRALLDAASRLAPSGMLIETHSIDEIPLYNADVEARGDPAPVERLKSAIRAADGLLIATPEYNYGIPGVLKNAIDWASRPPGHSVLNGKPAALMGASPGMSGTMRAQLQLRQAFVFTQTHVLLQPEVLVAHAAQKFTDRNLTDEPTRQVLAKMLVAFAEWIRRLAPS